MSASFSPSGFDAMEYAKPAYSVQQVNLAGRTIRDIEDYSDDQIRDALRVINNWRASHSFPLNSFHITLKNRTKKIHAQGFTAQRIKRLISIVTKLWDKQDMKLTQMQDIGGCRAILPTLDHVYKLRESYRTNPVIHAFHSEKDYIKEPAETGYRSIHLKYRFSGATTTLPYHGLKIELQLRTSLQHRWATAVEAAGTFTQQALKSNRGKLEWLRFFALMSSVFALRENCVTVPGTPTTLPELYDEIRTLNKQHYISSVFSQYRAIIPHIEKMSDAKYFLLTLNPLEMMTSVKGFKKDESQAANASYTEAERKLPKDSPIQIVLVSVSTIGSLKRAYPNYFLDTKDFLGDLKAIIEGSPKR